ncbi:MAG: coenzyme F420-0:L-glutamate ligase [Anaerolineales bacterium]|nr:coenzyme F420-0:L-glutamate ligase [Anaerolineales bacterium]
MTANAPPTLTLTALPGIPLVEPGDDIAAFIVQALDEAGIALAPDDIMVVAQKIVSKAEGRFVFLDEVEASEAAQQLAALTGKAARYLQVVLDEAVRVERARRGVIVTETTGGWVVANSAVDRSNVSQEGGERLLLLPADPDGSARRLRKAIAARTGQRVAIIISDSHGRPFRLGAVGVAIGVAGLPPLTDLRGQPDLFGYELQSTIMATADEIAAAASLLQGQTTQRSPVVHLRGLRLPTDDEATARWLQRPRDEDMFRAGWVNPTPGEEA